MPNLLTVVVCGYALSLCVAMAVISAGVAGFYDIADAAQLSIVLLFLGNIVTGAMAMSIAVINNLSGPNPGKSETLVIAEKALDTVKDAGVKIR